MTEQHSRERFLWIWQLLFSNNFVLYFILGSSKTESYAVVSWGNSNHTLKRIAKAEWKKKAEKGKLLFLSYKRFWNHTFRMFSVGFFLINCGGKKILLFKSDRLICLNTWTTTDSTFGLIQAYIILTQACESVVARLSVTRCCPNIALCCCLIYAGSKTELAETQPFPVCWSSVGEA